MKEIQLFNEVTKNREGKLTFFIQLSPKEDEELRGLVKEVNKTLFSQWESGKIYVVNFRTVNSKSVKEALVYCVEKSGFKAEISYALKAEYLWTLLLSLKKEKTFWQKIGLKK